MAASDAGKVRALDWVVVGAALLAYIASLLPWYQATVSVLTITRTASANAWHAGIGAWLAVLLLLAAGLVVLVTMLGGRLRLPASRPLITLTLSVLALVTILVRWATFPNATGGVSGDGELDLGAALDVSSGAGVGLYLGLIAAIAAAMASFLTFRAAGRSTVS